MKATFPLRENEFCFSDFSMMIYRVRHLRGGDHATRPRRPFPITESTRWSQTPYLVVLQGANIPYFVVENKKRNVYNAQDYHLDARWCGMTKLVIRPDLGWRCVSARR